MSTTQQLTSNSAANADAFGPRFQVTQFLGQGAGGPVSAAYDKQQQQQQQQNNRELVALKRINSKNARAEYSLLLQLQHPNVIRALELIEGEGDARPTAKSNNSNVNNNTILMMEFAALGNAARASMNLAKAASIAQREWYAQIVTRDVLRALHHLHRHSVVHRDVKASNVLLVPLESPQQQQQQQQNATAATSVRSNTSDNNNNNVNDSSLVALDPEALRLDNSNNANNEATEIKKSETATTNINNPKAILHQPFIAKLSDFGLATPVDEDDVHSNNSKNNNKNKGNKKSDDEIAGSVYWMSPEALQGSISSTVDIWALGCMAYELLNGGRPPLGEREWGNALYTVLSCADEKKPSLVNVLMQNERDQRKKQQQQQQQRLPLTILDEVSPPCLDFLTKALTVDPRLRPTAADLLNHDWVRGSATLQQQGPPPTPRQQDSLLSDPQQQQPQQQPQSTATTDYSNRSSDTLEQIITACSGGVAGANRNWLWLPKGSARHQNHGAIGAAAGAALSDSVNGTGAAAGAATMNSSSVIINDVSQITADHRALMTERIKEMIDRLRRTGEVVREKMLAATNPFATDGTGVLKFENWADVLPPSRGGEQQQHNSSKSSASRQQQQQAKGGNSSNNGNSADNICLQAQVLLARVVWALAFVVDPNLATSAAIRPPRLGQSIQAYQQQQLQSYQQLLAAQQRQQQQQQSQSAGGGAAPAAVSSATAATSSTTTTTNDAEHIFTRRALLVDLAECGFWRSSSSSSSSSSSNIDWSLLFPNIKTLTRASPGNLAGVEGRARYHEVCRDVAKALYVLFAASCTEPDLRCAVGCVKSAHTIRYLFAHEETRRETALILCSAMDRISGAQQQQQQQQQSIASQQQQQQLNDTLSASMRSNGSSSEQRHGNNNSNDPFQQVAAAGTPNATTSLSTSSQVIGVYQHHNHNHNINSQGVSNSNNMVQRTAIALREFLPHFIDDAAVAAASDSATDGDLRAFDACCDAFLRVTRDSTDDLFLQTVSSPVFLRKLHVCLPPNHVSSFAVGILTRYAQAAANVDVEELMSLVPLRTWLTLASNIDLTYIRTVEVVEVLARLRVVPDIVNSLVKQHPVISFVLTMPVDPINYNTQAPTRMLRALTELCLEPVLGAAYACSLSIRDGAVARLRDAAHRKNNDETVAALQLLGALFTHSPNPDTYSNCDELCRLLVRLVRQPMNERTRATIQHASRLFDTLCAVALF